MFAEHKKRLSIHAQYARRANTARIPREYMRAAYNLCGRLKKVCIAFSPVYSVVYPHPCSSVFICGSKDF